MMEFIELSDDVWFQALADKFLGIRIINALARFSLSEGQFKIPRGRTQSPSSGIKYWE